MTTTQLRSVAIDGMGMLAVGTIAAVGAPVVAGVLVMLGVYVLWHGLPPKITKIVKSHPLFLMAGRAGAALAASALLLVTTCLAAPGLEGKQDAKALASPAALTLLVESLDSTNAATRFYAVDSLGKIGGSATIAPLAKALYDPDVCVRIAAARALGRNADPAATPFLISVLKTEKNFDVWDMAAKPLLDTGSAAIPSFLEVFWKAETSEIRAFASTALSTLGWEPKTQDEKTAYYMIRLDDYTEEMSAIGPVVIPAMVKLLAEENGKYRVAAVWVLGGIKDHRVIKPLVKALVDSNPEVRKAARVNFRSTGFDSVLKNTGIKGYLLILACRFLASLVYTATKLISCFRQRHNVRSDSPKGSGITVKFAKALFSLDLLFTLSCIASLSVFYIYTNQYIKATMSFDLLMYDPLVILFPAIVMIFVLDIVRIIFKAAGFSRGSPVRR